MSFNGPPLDDSIPLERYLPNVPRGTLEKFQRYLDLVGQWNQKTNLTGAKNPQDFCRQHFLDCFQACQQLQLGSDCLDVGSGAGLPGIVWACLFSDCHFHLVEANQKKAAFLQWVVSQLPLQNTQVYARRYEDLTSGDLNLHGAQSPIIVSRGTLQPKKIWPLILRSAIPFSSWLIFSSSSTHEEFLTLSKNSVMKISSLPYSRDLEEEAKQDGILTQISRV